MLPPRQAQPPTHSFPSEPTVPRRSTSPFRCEGRRLLLPWPVRRFRQGSEGMDQRSHLGCYVDNLKAPEHATWPRTDQFAWNCSQPFDPEPKGLPAWQGRARPRLLHLLSRSRLIVKLSVRNLVGLLHGE